MAEPVSVTKAAAASESSFTRNERDLEAVADSAHSLNNRVVQCRPDLDIYRFFNELLNRAASCRSAQAKEIP
jgi:hypothetical protein